MVMRRGSPLTVHGKAIVRANPGPRTGAKAIASRRGSPLTVAQAIVAQGLAPTYVLEQEVLYVRANPGPPAIAKDIVRRGGGDPPPTLAKALVRANLGQRTTARADSTALLSLRSGPEGASAGCGAPLGGDREGALAGCEAADMFWGRGPYGEIKLKRNPSVRRAIWATISQKRRERARGPSWPPAQRPAAAADRLARFRIERRAPKNRPRQPKPAAQLRAAAVLLRAGGRPTKGHNREQRKGPNWGPGVTVGTP